MKTKFNLLILLGLILILVGDTLGQNKTYYSIETKPEYIGSWNTDSLGGGTAPASFDLGDTFIIISGKNMVTEAIWSVSGTNSKVQIQSGGILQANHPVTLSNETTFQIDNGGKYIHNNTYEYSSTIFQAGTKIFLEKSVFEIKKSAASLVNTGEISFGTLVIDFSTGQTENVNFNSNVNIIQDTLKIKSTNGKIFSMADQNNPLTLNISGNFIIEGGIFSFCEGTSSTSRAYIMNINKDYIQSGGEFKHNNTRADSKLKVVFKGNGNSFTKAGGDIDTNNINWEVNISSGTFNINSNFKVSTPSTLTLTNGTLNIAADKRLTVSGEIDFKENIITGSGYFELAFEGKIKTKHLEGIVKEIGTYAGSIQVTGKRDFSQGGSYEFNGANLQETGTAVESCNELRINNNEGIKLTNKIVVNGTLYYYKGTINNNGKSIEYGSIATLSYFNTTEVQTTDNEFPNSSGPKHLYVDANSIVKLHSNRTVNGNVDLYGIFDTQNNYINGTTGTFYVYGTLKTSNTSGVEGSIQKANKYFDVTAKYVFYGSETNQVTGHSFSECRSIQILNSNGVTLSNDITLTQNLDVSGGKLILGNKNVTIGADAIITGYGSSYYVNTNSTGLMYRYCKTNADALFPIGNTAYNPATVRITGGDEGNFSATVKDSYTNNPPDPTKCVTREWNVSNNTGGSPTVTLKFQFNTGEYGANFQPAGQIVVGHYSGGAWTELPATISGGEASYLVEAGSISSFSYFTVGNQGAMPVELMAFSGNAVGNQVKLSWSTSSEINNKGFDIERQFSSNGNSYSEWSKVGFIQGNGNSTGIINYNFTDKCTETGKYKYRLKQIDYNGNFEYHNLSTLIDVGTPKKFEISQNYPNPFNPTTKIDFTLPKDANVLIAIFDITGKEVLKVVNENMKAGYYTKDINLSNQSSGVYFYRIISTAGSEKFVDTKKMVLLK